MAPKRSPAAISSLPAKKQRTEEPDKVPKCISREQCLRDVEEALEKIEDVSDTGREMLRLIVKGSLGALPEERHRFQHAACQMVEEALRSEEDTMRQNLSRATSEVSGCLAAIEARMQELKNAKEAFGARVAAFHTAKAAFLADNQALQMQRKSLDVAKEERLLCQSKLNEVIGPKHELESAVKTHMPAIISGAPAPIQANVEAVTPLLAQVQLEDSLRGAAISSIKLAPEARGFFDKAVLEQLSAALTKLLEKVPAAEAEYAAVKVAEEKEAAARSVFLEARAKQARSAHDLRVAELEVREAEGVEGVSIETLRDSEEVHLCSEHQRRASEKHLQEFQDSAIASLQVLLQPLAESAAPDDAKMNHEDRTHPAAPMAAGVPTPMRAAATVA